MAQYVYCVLVITINLCCLTAPLDNTINLLCPMALLNNMFIVLSNGTIKQYVYCIVQWYY